MVRNGLANSDGRIERLVVWRHGYGPAGIFYIQKCRVWTPAPGLLNHPISYPEGDTMAWWSQTWDITGNKEELGIDNPLWWSLLYLRDNIIWNQKWKCWGKWPILTSTSDRRRHIKYEFWPSSDFSAFCSLWFFSQNSNDQDSLLYAMCKHNANLCGQRLHYLW